MRAFNDHMSCICNTRNICLRILSLMITFYLKIGFNYFFSCVELLRTFKKLIYIYIYINRKSLLYIIRYTITKCNSKFDKKKNQGQLNFSSHWMLHFLFDVTIITGFETSSTSRKLEITRDPNSIIK